MNLLFWNIGKKSIESIIAQCIIENDVDIAIFAEHQSSDFNRVCDLLGKKYRHIEGYGGCKKITMVCRHPLKVDIKQEQNRYTLYKIKTKDKEYIMCGVHLQDRMSAAPALRIEEIGRIVYDIEKLENQSGCRNTIIIGDLNSNPYDDELLQMNAFHAVLYKDVIKQSETRTVAGRKYRRFYNPILNFISEETKLYGSFYYNQDPATSVWHCYDQILVSKQLVDSICRFEYLKAIGKTSLMSSVRPNKKISDHLPLLVEIKEEK